MGPRQRMHVSCGAPWKTKSSSHLLLGDMKRRFPVEQHGHFSADSNILPHFPWYGRPLYPLALPLWPPDLTHKILFHPPPSSLPVLYPPFLPSPNPCGASSWWMAPQERLREGLALLSGTFQSHSKDGERQIESGLAEILEHERNEGKNMLRAKALKKIRKIVSLCKQSLPSVTAVVSTFSLGYHYTLIFHHLYLTQPHSACVVCCQ